MQSQSFSGVSIHILTYTQEAIDGRVMTDTRTYTHPCLPLILRAHKHTHTSRGASFIALPGALPDTHTHTHTHKQLCTGDLFNDDAHIRTPLLTFDCVAQHMFLFHVYRSGSLARMRRYTQLAYLFHQCATSLLSRDSRIADCTVRHPGVERPFSSFLRLLMGLLL